MGAFVMSLWISSTLSAQVGVTFVVAVRSGVWDDLGTLNESLHAFPDGSNVQTRVNLATSGCTSPQSKEKAAPTIITVGLPWPMQYKCTYSRQHR